MHAPYIRRHRMIAAIVTCISVGYIHGVSADAHLIFKSNFGEGVRILHSTTEEVPDTIIGTDKETGFSWSELDGGDYFREVKFQYVASQPYTDWVTTDIRQVPGPGGAPTKALFIEVKGADPTKYAPTRNELEFRPKWGTSQTQYYATYWMKIDPAYKTTWPILDGDAWGSLIALKEPWNSNLPGSTSDQWRFSLQIHRSGNTPYWRVRINQDQPVQIREYDGKNLDVPVPIGEWFKVEFFVKYSGSATDGRLFFAVNGRTVFDLHRRIGHATDPKGIDFISLCKIYHDRQWYENGVSTHHYYTGLEIWTDFPTKGSTQSAPSTPNGVSVTVVGG